MCVCLFAIEKNIISANKKQSIRSYVDFSQMISEKLIFKWETMENICLKKYKKNPFIYLFKMFKWMSLFNILFFDWWIKIYQF